MTTSALTGGFAVCQTRLGAKGHDPKDPGSDLGPMFRQVVGTILRLAAAHPDAWLGVRGSHDVPAYGFERIIDPPPLEVNAIRLLSEFHGGSLTLAETWRRALDPANADAVLALAEEAGTLAEAASRRARSGRAHGHAARRLGIGGENDTARVTTLEMAEALVAFHFPDELWARVIYDLVLAVRRADVETGPLVAALVPIYFGRVGSFVIENRNLTTADAEERVERQARQFELLKPYLVDRWRARDEPAADTYRAPS